MRRTLSVNPPFFSYFFVRQINVRGTWEYGPTEPVRGSTVKTRSVNSLPAYAGEIKLPAVSS